MHLPECVPLPRRLVRRDPFGQMTPNQDSNKLLATLARRKERPSVIYADPPYTDDQYSRFYHIFETLIIYDRPLLSGVGLYRPDRFRTSFSLVSEAPLALERLVAQSARLGADIVLSYPSNGLIQRAGHSPSEIIKRHYSRVEREYALTHQHSTFGASKGAAKAVVLEQLFIGRNP